MPAISNARRSRIALFLYGAAVLFLGAGALLSVLSTSIQGLAIGGIVAASLALSATSVLLSKVK